MANKRRYLTGSSLNLAGTERAKIQLKFYLRILELPENFRVAVLEHL